MATKNMKFISFSIWFSIVAMLVFALPQESNAETEATATLENYIGNNNNPSFGYEINNFGNTGVTKNLSAMPPSIIVDGPSQTQPYIGSDSKVYTGRGYYFEQELYTKDEVLRFIKEDKDIIQDFGKLYDIPIPGEPIKLWDSFPANRYDLGGTQFTGPANGSVKETIERAKAYAYYKYGSQNMVISASYLYYNISAVGSSGGQLGTGTIQGEFTSTAGLAPSTGVTASMVYRVPVVVVNCFSNHLASNFPKDINLLGNSKQLLINDYSVSLNKDQEEVIRHNANLLSDKLTQAGPKIELLVFAPGASSKKLNPVVQKIMNILGASLYRAENDDDYLDKVIKAKIITTQNDDVSRSLNANGALAFLVLNVN